MKKIYLVLFTVFLNSMFFSCTPPSLGGEEVIETEIAECCDEDGEILPPPPPPPPPPTTTGSGE